MLPALPAVSRTCRSTSRSRRGSSKQASHSISRINAISPWSVIRTALSSVESATASYDGPLGVEIRLSDQPPISLTIPKT